MFELIRLGRKDVADLLLQVLARDGIQGELRQQEDGWQVLVPGDKLAEAQQQLERFQSDPIQLNQAAWQTNKPTAEGLSFGGLSQGSQRFGPVTLLVLVICILIYLSPMVMGATLYDALFFPSQLSELASAPWRLFTPALLHFSVMHIAFDMIWWLILGNQIEQKQSGWRLIGLALVIAAVSNMAEYWVIPPGARFGGMSGVVYGLLAYVWLQGKLNPSGGLFIQNSIFVFMLGWLVLCWTGLFGPIANMAHLGGLLTGLALGGLFWVIGKKSEIGGNLG